ncbi:MAG: hypothetical protein LBS96_09885 [Oscillospiraceae bacterium]|jgi:multisubunit Na+/H+ antiporter MnhB subunit|nr:hypothetical protein [Oscillospiraceae bacterium]
MGYFFHTAPTAFYVTIVAVVLLFLVFEIIGFRKRAEKRNFLLFEITSGVGGILAIIAKVIFDKRSNTAPCGASPHGAGLFFCG